MVSPTGPTLMAVEVEVGKTFRTGTPSELMKVTPRPGGLKYDVTADGARFLSSGMSRSEVASKQSHRQRVVHREIGGL